MPANPGIKKVGATKTLCIQRIYELSSYNFRNAFITVVYLLSKYDSNTFYNNR